MSDNGAWGLWHNNPQEIVHCTCYWVNYNEWIITEYHKPEESKPQGYWDQYNLQHI